MLKKQNRGSEGTGVCAVQAVVSTLKGERSASRCPKQKGKDADNDVFLPFYSIHIIIEHRSKSIPYYYGFNADTNYVFCKHWLFQPTPSDAKNRQFTAGGVQAAGRFFANGTVVANYAV